MGVLAWDDSLSVVRVPCFYSVWPNSCRVLGMLALSCCLCGFCPPTMVQVPNQHCVLSCQPHWLSCHTLRYHCLCWMSFISFKKGDKNIRIGVCLSFFLFFSLSFLILNFKIISNLRKPNKNILWHMFILPESFEIKLKRRCPFITMYFNVFSFFFSLLL